MGKKKGKHVLMPPLEIKWPTLDKDTEEKIISALTLKLQEFPSLESKRTKEGGKKLGEQSALPRPDLSPQDEEQLKARLRQQLVIGFRQVSKALEWNQLSLVLTAGNVQPPVLGQGLYMLVASRKCPALCFPRLHPWLTSAIGIDSILALGFKKAEVADGPNDFGEFVTMATALAPPLKLPGANPSTGESTAGSKGDSTSAGGASAVDEAMEEESGVEAALPVKDWQVMEPEKEKVVMDKLLELLTPYKAILQTPKSQLTPQDLQTRKSINLCIPMDLGAVKKAGESGQLDLLLLQKEAGSPRHPVMAAVVRAAAAAGKGCAMLQLATLRSGLRAVVQGSQVQAVGFRKTQFTSTQQSEEIRQFVTMATQYSPTRPDVSASSPCADNSSQKQGQSTQSETSPKRQKFSAPVYDVSSFYVYKKDEDKHTAETRRKSSSASDIYISLSSEPTVQYLGVKSLSNDAPIPGTAFIDNRGSGIPGKCLMAEKAATMQEESQSTDTKSSAGFLGVMGLDTVDAPAVPTSAYHEPRGKKPKANLKRALDKSTDRGEFVSFKMRRTDIGLSVPNPNKKKNKKFKKK